MDDVILLSILTPAVPSRILYSVDSLCKKLNWFIGKFPVEHLVLIDNKRRTVGEKRDALLRMAHGKYVAFVDDDDDISAEYIPEILHAIESGSDVVTFRQKATVNGQSAGIEFRLGHPNEPFVPDKLIKRNAWHVCAWRRSLAIRSVFPPSNYGEDWVWAEPLCKLAKTEVHIPKVLHFYNHSSKTTEAPLLV